MRRLALVLAALLVLLLLLLLPHQLLLLPLLLVRADGCVVVSCAGENWLLECATVLIFGGLYCWMAWGLVWSAGLSLVAGWCAPRPRPSSPCCCAFFCWQLL